MKNRLLLYFLGIMTTLVFSCKKQGTSIPPAVAAFTSEELVPYYVTDDPDTKLEIPVGVSNVSDKDRTVNFTVTSTTGAKEGVEYTLPSKSIVIPAHEAINSIVLKGIYNAIPSGVTDTLVFTITGGDVPPTIQQKEIKVVLQRYCEVVLSDFTGLYTIQDYVDGAPDGGPYQVELTPGTATGTKGFVTMKGLWGVNSPTVKIELDWTNPAAFKTNIPVMNWYVHGTYGQVKLSPFGQGTFSSCSNSFTIKYEATVSLGSFGGYTSILTK